MYNRREFLSGAASLGVGLLVEACAPTKRAPVPKTPKPLPIETPSPEDYKRRAIAEIRSLPESNIKSALESRVVPMLENVPPFTIQLGGEEITVNRVTVKDSLVANKETGVDATYNGRITIAEKKYNPLAPFKTLIPAIGVVRSFELPQVPPELKLPDGTPATPLEAATNSFLDKSIAPDIAVVVGWDGKSGSSEDLQALKTYGYVKESCTLLLDLLQAEAIINKMRQFGLTTRIDARDQNGILENISIIPEALALRSKNKGRSLALLDLGGYVLGIKALSGTSTLRLLTESGAIEPSIATLIEKTDLGSTEQDLLLKSYELVLNNSSIQGLPHAGKLNIFP